MKLKSSRVMKVFEQYVKKYDMNNANIKMRYFHSLKVMEICRDIALVTGLFNEEEVIVCELIGLFHEIANFDEMPSYRLTDETDNEDYALKSARMMFDNNILRDITDDTTYDNIIKLAIFAYDKNGLPKGIDDKSAAFCNVLRDAHKIDNFRIMLNYPYIDSRITTYPSAMVYDNFKKLRVIERKLTENNSDEILAVLSDAFDLNYRYSYALLKNNNYISKIIESLTFTSKEVEGFFKQIEKVLITYVDRKIG